MANKDLGNGTFTFGFKSEASVLHKDPFLCRVIDMEETLKTLLSFAEYEENQFLHRELQKLETHRGALEDMYRMGEEV